MKNLTLFTMIFLMASVSVAQKNKGSFGPGEELVYRIKYGFIDAGEATLKVAEDDKSFDQETVYHFESRGKTVGTFNIFYRVRNRYNSYVDQKKLLPILYTENIREGDYKRKTFAAFDHKNNSVKTNNGTYEIPENAQDVISSFYYLRNAYPNNLVGGEEVTLNFFLGKETNPLSVKYIGKETITTDLGTFNCLKFSPKLTPGRIFKKDSQMFLWVTDDLNRIPLKAEVEILIGTVYLELTKYEGLVNPLTSKIQ
ncbi:MAG: hypothetical protein ACJATA_000745 [Sphingobacteriales bacterium]|jgi:hypothetical protein